MLFTLSCHKAVFRHFTMSFTGCFFLQLSFLSFALFVNEAHIAPQPTAEEKRFCVCCSDCLINDPCIYNRSVLWNECIGHGHLMVKVLAVFSLTFDWQCQPHIFINVSFDSFRDLLGIIEKGDAWVKGAEKNHILLGPTLPFLCRFHSIYCVVILHHLLAFFIFHFYVCFCAVLAPISITWWYVLRFCLWTSYRSFFLLLVTTCSVTYIKYIIIYVTLHVVKNITLRKCTWIGGRNVGK